MAHSFCNAAATTVDSCSSSSGNCRVTLLKPRLTIQATVPAMSHWVRHTQRPSDSDDFTSSIVLCRDSGAAMCSFMPDISSDTINLCALALTDYCLRYMLLPQGLDQFAGNTLNFPAAPDADLTDEQSDLHCLSRFLSV